LFPSLASNVITDRGADSNALRERRATDAPGLILKTLAKLPIGIVADIICRAAKHPFRSLIV